VKIIDEEGQTVPFGEAGEIAVRRSLPFLGYLQKGEGGMRKAADGWVYTDDAGRLSVDGYLSVLGRRAQVIKRGTRFIYSAEVENLIMEFDGVDKVGNGNLFRTICVYTEHYVEIHK
jgi:long-chain acyl-CoA synthetase